MNKCAICGDEIPNKTRDELIDMGYNFLLLEGEYYSFCPKHNVREITQFILKKIREVDRNEKGKSNWTARGVIKMKIKLNYIMVGLSTFLIVLQAVRLAKSFNYDYLTIVFLAMIIITYNLRGD